MKIKDLAAYRCQKTPKDRDYHYVEFPRANILILVLDSLCKEGDFRGSIRMLTGVYSHILSPM
jgi:hypothetical protein